MQDSDAVGRVIGAIVFAAGIGVLVFVFVLAHGFFTAQENSLLAAPQSSEASAVGQLGASAVNLLARIGLLAVMAGVGSLIAGRGLQLYFGASAQGRSKRQAGD